MKNILNAWASEKWKPLWTIVISCTQNVTYTDVGACECLGFDEGEKKNYVHFKIVNYDIYLGNIHLKIRADVKHYFKGATRKLCASM